METHRYQIMPRKPRYPTHAEVTTFLETFLPPQVNAKDVPFLYHTPRHPTYSPTRSIASRIVFSLTPTPGIYTALDAPDLQHPPVCFLHRPWSLDRRAVRRGSLILACHQSFDANLTVGWNVALAKRLHANLDGATCIQGYKGDLERKIGIVAMLNRSMALGSMVQMIQTEFGGAGDVFRHDDGDPATDDDDRQIEVLAIMNAFHADEVDRVLSASRTPAWPGRWEDGSRILYLTGAAREAGLEAAAKVNMPVVCVGHRSCEEWGIRFLAEETRKRWPGVDVIEILEEEELTKPKAQEGRMSKETRNAEDSQITGQPTKKPGE